MALATSKCSPDEHAVPQPDTHKLDGRHDGDAIGLLQHKKVAVLTDQKLGACRQCSRDKQVVIGITAEFPAEESRFGVYGFCCDPSQRP